MRRILIALAVVAAVATPAAAQTIAQGAGTAPCSKITDLYRRYPAPVIKTQIDTMVVSWAYGFMSSGNFARSLQGKDSRDLGAMTMDAATAALRRWCKAHPNEQLMAGVMELFATFPSNHDAGVAGVDAPR